MSRIDSLVTVTLLCGCRVNVRLKPMRPSSKYVCRSGLGHSYNQLWRSYTDNGRTFENPNVPVKA